MNNDDWVKLRDSYLDWLAEWPNKIGLKKKLLWRGYSLWWSTNLIAKDTYIANGWLIKLCSRLNGSDIRRSETNPNRRGSRHIVYFLFLDVFRFFVVKLFVAKNKPSKKDVYFFSLQINLTEIDGIIRDRHYSDLHIKDNKYQMTSGYLVSLSKAVPEIIRPFHFRNKVKKLLVNSERDVIIVDPYIKFSDVLSIHFGVIKLWLSYILQKRNKAFRNSVVIAGVQCEDILLDELEQSFFGSLQTSLNRAISVKRWLEDIQCDAKIVTYLETVSAIRPIYHFGKEVSKGNTFIALQHSTLNKNKIDFFHRQQEFNPSIGDGVIYSPKPDFYLVQGSQAKKMVGEFFEPDKIFIIGSVKFDRYRKVLNDIRAIGNRVEKIINKQDNFIVLIAPSFGIDALNILSMFKSVDFNYNDYKYLRFIIAPHPLVKQKEILNIIDNLKLADIFEFYFELSTQELIIASDLVICGYSSIALESLIFLRPSMRVVDNRTIPLFEDEPGIPYIHTQDQFWSSLMSFTNQSFLKKKKVDHTKLISNYFYKIDGLASDRFWKFIRDIN